MTDQNVSTLIENARQQTIQSQVREPVLNNLGHVFGVAWMAQAGQTMPPWWSPARDRALRKFWKRSDHLSGAIYAMTSKMTAIPRHIIARDPSIKSHARQANQLTEFLMASTQFGDGWEEFFSRFVEDLVTTDNGAFAEIIGPGDPSGPLTGMPLSIAHLDSSRCQRTGNAEFPVIYTDVSGNLYKLHYTRVIYISQLSSPIAEMFGVGFSAVSRCLGIAQNLIDITTYKQEKLGSRPHRAIAITQGGLAPADLYNALQLAESGMNSQGLSRYSKIVIGGEATLPEADVKLLELSGLPEGFDEETSINYGMAAIALALGVDARELFPAMSAGATRADALLAHLKQRGKGPGQIIQSVEQQMNHKYLPPHLEFTFDFQDDAQDRQKAEIRQVRANRNQVMVNTGAFNTRTTREQMLEEGDLTQEQFENMELEDGRNPDGGHILSLFYGNNEFLDLGLADPLDKAANDAETMQQVITEHVLTANQALINAQSNPRKRKALFALFALAHLSKYYEDESQNLSSMLLTGDVPKATNVRSPETRLRNKDPQQVEEENTDQNSENFEQDTDDTNEVPEQRNTRIRRKA